MTLDTTVTVTLTSSQRELLHELIGDALDQAHDAEDMGGWETYLADRHDTTADELVSLVEALGPPELAAQYRADHKLRAELA